MTGGQIQCWGAGALGELGDGRAVDSAEPVLVSGIDDAVAVSVGYGNSAAVRENGEVLSWGYRFGSFPRAGELLARIPQVADDLSDVIGISLPSASPTGEGAACVVRANGSVLCAATADE
jgi:alpha-tubulin suppressor-like RCC1 family protein